MRVTISDHVSNGLNQMTKWKNDWNVSRASVFFWIIYTKIHGSELMQSLSLSLSPHNKNHLSHFMWFSIRFASMKLNKWPLCPTWNQYVWKESILYQSISRAILHTYVLGRLRWYGDQKWIQRKRVRNRHLLSQHPYIININAQARVYQAHLAHAVLTFITFLEQFSTIKTKMTIKKQA